MLSRHATTHCLVALALAACAGPSQPAATALEEPQSAGAASAPTPVTGDDPLAPEATTDPSPPTSEAPPSSAPPSAPTSADAVEPWRVTHANNEGAWSMDALGEDAVVLLTHANLRQTGYDPMGTTMFVEARDASFALRWRVVTPELANAVVASPEGGRVLVLGATESRLLSGSDGSELAVLPGASQLALLDGEGRAIRAISGRGVEVRDADGTVHTIAVSGTAPSTIHAMMTSGECETIFTEDAVHVTSLASADGVLAIGASDGSIRLHELAASADVEQRLTRDDLPRLPGGAISPIGLSLRGHDLLIAVYSDGSIAHWNLRSRARVRTAGGPCTGAELRRIAVIPGLPEDVVACGYASLSRIGTDVIALAGGSGARMRTLEGRPLAGFPTLHGNGLALVRGELWLAGTDSQIERWSRDGRFRGTHRLGTGWANVVALSREHVAVMGMREGEVHGTETDAPPRTRLWRIADGQEVAGFEDVRGPLRFVGETRVVATLGSGAVVVRELASAVERLRIAPGELEDAGLPSAAVSVVPAAENTLVVGDRVHLVRPDEIRELGAAPPLPDVGVVTELAASRDGARLARVVFDPASFSFTLELFAIEAGQSRLVHRRERVGEHVAMRADGTQVLVSSRGGAAMLLDAATGAALPFPAVVSAWVGFDARDRPCLQSQALDARLACLEGEAFVVAGPRLLVPTAMTALGARSVAFALGSGAYVLDAEGRTLAYVGGVDGDGFAITTPSGLLAASRGSHDELFVRHGARADTVAGDVRDLERWRALVSP